jgi:hypothetical protein
MHTPGPWDIQWQYDKSRDALWGTIAHTPSPERGKPAVVYESVSVFGDNKQANSKLITQAPKLLSTLAALAESFRMALSIDEEGRDPDGFTYVNLALAESLIESLGGPK